MNQEETETLLAEFKRIADKISDPAYQAEVERHIYPKLAGARRAHLNFHASSLTARHPRTLRQAGSITEAT